MNLKMGSGIAMFVLLAGLIVVAGPASAWERPLAGTRTRSEIQKTCSAEGGSYTDSAADHSYSCNKGGNYVVCQYGSGKCTGGGHGKDPAARLVQIGIHDVLGGVQPANEVQPPGNLPPRGVGGMKAPVAPGQEPVAR